jgi:acetamidase/formamidase
MGSSSNAGTSETGRKHHLRSTPQTVHWGFLDGSLKPVLTVEPGDRVTIDCITCTPESSPAKGSGMELLPEMAEVFAKAPRGAGAHIMTGPVSVRGAEIGDVLEVRIIDIKPRIDWGFNLFRPYGGTLPDDFPHPGLVHIPLDLERGVASVAGGFEIPARPFFGQLAVQPPLAAGRQSSKEPREYGGNLDCKELTAGATIYLPCWVPGGGFSTGDGHWSQGDGEVDGTAIETCLSGVFEFHVRKDLGWRMPRAETPTHYIAFGLDPDLDDAAKQALREMISWITAMTNLSRDDAYRLCSYICDLHVTQTVNNVKGVHAMLPKSILQRGTR